MGDRQRIALINAVPAAITPAREALEVELPGVDVWSILDDRLLQDANTAGALTEPLRERMRRLIQHAVTEGADGILLTCSMYGPVANEFDGAGIPVRAADDAAFDAVAALPTGTRVAVVSGQPAPLLDTIDRLQTHLEVRGAHVELVPVVADGAPEAAAAGNVDQLAAVITSALGEIDPVVAIFLAQYSLAPASTALATATGLDVITGPGRAAASIRSSISTKEHHA